MNEIEDYRKKIEELAENLDDNFLLGYSEAILNILGEFTNGQCADCPFSYEVESYSPDFIYLNIFFLYSSNFAFLLNLFQYSYYYSCYTYSDAYTSYYHIFIHKS